MKIKYRDIVIDGSNEHIIVTLTEQDKKNIANMAPECMTYAVYPEDWTIDIREFEDTSVFRWFGQK